MPIILSIILAALLAGQAAAQEDSIEMQLQRCVWSCLANSNGADDPAYNLCVERVCSDLSEALFQQDGSVAGPGIDDAPPAGGMTESAAPAEASPTISSPAWTVLALSPDTPPNLDGRLARTASPDGRLWFSYVCSRAGHAYVYIDGPSVAVLAARAPLVQVRFDPDRGIGFELGMAASPGALAAAVERGGIFLSALKSSGTATVSSGGAMIGSISLSGLAGATAEADAYCFPG